MKPGRCRNCDTRLRRNERALCSRCSWNLDRATAERLRAAAPEVETSDLLAERRESLLRAEESPLGWRNLLLAMAIGGVTTKKVGRA